MVGLHRKIQFTLQHFKRNKFLERMNILFIDIFSHSKVIITLTPWKKFTRKFVSISESERYSFAFEWKWRSSTFIKPIKPTIIFDRFITRYNIILLYQKKKKDWEKRHKEEENRIKISSLKNSILEFNLRIVSESPSIDKFRIKIQRSRIVQLKEKEKKKKYSLDHNRSIESKWRACHTRRAKPTGFN